MLSYYLAQMNPTVGALDANTQAIKAHWVAAETNGADLLLLPEMAVTGYPSEDLVLKPSFLDHVEKCVQDLVSFSHNQKSAALIPCPWRENDKIYNAALLVEHGEITHKIYKHHLPNYDVFDEARIFKSAPMPNAVSFRDTTLGIIICEDLWFSDVPKHLKDQGAQILISINASPYEHDKHAERHEYAARAVRDTELPLIYLNQVGGQDELVFDGGSFGLDAKGAQCFSFPNFVSHEQMFDGAPFQHDQLNADAAIYEAMALGLADYVRKNGFSGVVLGLSGGVDSALTAVVAADALGADKVKAVMMPSQYTSQDSLDDAKTLADNLEIKLDSISIEPAVEGFSSVLQDNFGAAPSDITAQNIQSRCRGLILMGISNQTGAMVLSTGNKSEMAVGYATLYGDMNGGFNVLKDIYKTKVYELCRWRNSKSAVIPERILTKAPTAELKADQTDQDSLPDYDVLDDILQCLIEQDLSAQQIIAAGHDVDLVNRVWKLLDIAEYKRRQAPPGVKITSKAFGRDRRYPITNHFTKIIEKT